MSISVLASSRRYLPELAGGLWLLIYAGLKFQAVAVGLQPYEVNPYVFLFFDTVTIPSYVWGAGQLLRRLRRQGWGRQLLRPALIALVSLLLPYAYLFVRGGRRFPPAVSLIILSVLGLSLYLSWRRLRRRWQNRDLLPD